MFNQLLGRIGWSDLPSAFNYLIKEEISRNGVFTLHRGQNKATKEPVTVFVCSKKNDARHYQLAVRSMKKCKSIKHPSFLRVLETADVSSGVYIVTEEVTFLEAFSSQGDNLFSSSLSWNLYLIIDGIAFLHQNANAFHGAICPKTVFVTRQGEWKLGGLDLSHSKEEVKARSAESLMQNFTIGELRRVALNHPFASSFWDNEQNKIYSFGESSDDTYSPYALDRVAFCSLAAWAYAKVQATNPSCWKFQTNARMLPESLFKLCKKFMDPSTFRIESFDWDQLKSKALYFKDSELVQCMLFFSKITIKGNWDKEIFFEKTLPTLLNENRLSPAVQTNFILPRIINELESSVIPPPMLPKLVQLFVTCVNLISETEIFQRDAYGCFYKLMISNERSIRYFLLQSLGLYEQHITQHNAQQLFESVVLGLTDSSPELRDITLRAMLVFIPKVCRDRTCLDRGIRLMSRCVQGDDTQYIRTNAVICFAKLVPFLEPAVIADHIVPQFLVGMKDPFPPARLAALQGLCSCLSYIRARDKALKYLPALCPRLLDEDKQCQAVAFQALEMLTTSLRNEMMNPENEKTEPERSSATLAHKFSLFSSKAKDLPASNVTLPILSPQRPSPTKVVSDPMSPEADSARLVSAKEFDEDEEVTEPTCVREDGDASKFRGALRDASSDQSADDWGDLSSGTPRAENSNAAMVSSLWKTASKEAPRGTPLKSQIGDSPIPSLRKGGDDSFWEDFNAEARQPSDKKKSLGSKAKKTLK